MSNPPEKKPLSTPVKIAIGAGIGCGCLTGLFFVLGIVAAIMLPALLNQTTKIRASEAKQYVGALLRAQQVHFLDKRKFAEDPEDLDFPLPTSKNYNYSISVIDGAGSSLAMVKAVPKASASQPLYGFVGAAYANKAKSDGLTSDILVCKTTKPTNRVNSFVLPTTPTSVLACPSQTVSVSSP